MKLLDRFFKAPAQRKVASHLDEVEQEIYASDPDVTFHDKAVSDENAHHGINTEEEMSQSADPEPA
jgi:hypothetical protein